jgi:hypothetical protein
MLRDKNYAVKNLLHERGAQFVKNSTIASFRDDITLAPGFSFLQIACF